MKTTNLFCTKCNKRFTSDKAHVLCDVCSSPLDVEKVSNGKINTCSYSKSIIDRYHDFYPYLDSDANDTLGEGFTALVPSKKLAKNLNIKSLLFKNETQNPTWSFKDRGTLLGVLHAVSLGYKKIGTVSTGNMAVSVAAYGAKFGLDTYVLVNSNIAPEKLNPIAIHNPHLIKVEGDYGELYKKSLKIGKENDIYFLNSDVPFRVEGYKTLSYELCEQLDFNVPDYVVVPTSAGGNIRGIIKGFEEFKDIGLIDKMPTFVCAQASGCAPIVRAAHNQDAEVTRFDSPNTIAHAIENPLPPSGNVVLNKLKDNGIFISVTDEEILSAQAEIAGEGLFVQPASAVSYAAVKKLAAKEIFNETDTIVCVLTGSGLKYTAAFDKHNLKSHQCKLEDLGEFIKEV